MVNCTMQSCKTEYVHQKMQYNETKKDLEKQAKEMLVVSTVKVPNADKIVTEN